MDVLNLQNLLCFPSLCPRPAHTAVYTGAIKKFVIIQAVPALTVDKSTAAAHGPVSQSCYCTRLGGPQSVANVTRTIFRCRLAAADRNEASIVLCGNKLFLIRKLDRRAVPDITAELWKVSSLAMML